MKLSFSNIYSSSFSINRSSWMTCIISEIAISRLTVWRKPGGNKAMSRRRSKRHSRSWKRKKVSVTFTTVFNIQNIIDSYCISAITMSRRSLQTQSRVSATEGQVSQRGSRFQFRSRRVPFTRCEAGARPGGGLEHTGGAVLEKRRPDWCQELLHWSLATGTVRTEREGAVVNSVKHAKFYV